MITVKINDDAIHEALLRLAAGMSDMSRPMNDIGAALVRSSKSRIDEGVSPDGSAFAPLSQVTLDAYANSRPPKVSQGPLKQSGDMQSQIFHDYGPAHAEVASNAIQAAVMQFGAGAGAFGAHIGKDKRGRDHFHSIPWGDIPARPFLGVSEDDRDVIVEIVEEWLTDLAD
ncbi:phage virion morphogenesis protein [Oceaniglobus trochenteri]|uniref:phage virion morphogenesis protein n=1 Tax=Oceaniglobus trochenteri TaxID=2763260 RepID=UPI001CFFC332|nr:phage virion morphogenesis protein [Oceaniglobus trochenteri]